MKLWLHGSTLGGLIKKAMRQFIEPHNPEAARRAAEALKKGAAIHRHPGFGRRLMDEHDREIAIPFGKRGYVMRYRLDDDDIVILKIWHTLKYKP